MAYLRGKITAEAQSKKKKIMHVFLLSAPLRLCGLVVPLPLKFSTKVTFLPVQSIISSL